jgi:hypothetical protein
MLVIVGLVVAATVRPGLPAAADGYPVPAPAAFAERGVTEGFYSDFFFGKDPGTWTWPVRLDMLRFMARLRMNRFWYSPKNDRFASGDRWADLYPASFTDNAVRSWYPAAQGNTLRFAPIDYTGTGASEYRTAARAVLEPSVQVMWTGRDVVAPTVSAADATAITASWARRPILVDNAMANDVPIISPMGQVNIAPIAGRDAGLSARLPGFVIQGNRDPGSTELGLAMAGSYLLEPGTYDTGRALVDGVDQFVTHYTAASLDPATRQRLRWAVRDLVEYRFANWQMTKGLPGQTAPIAVKTFRNWVRPNLDRVNAAVAAGNRESTRQLYRDVRDTVRAMNEAPALLGQLTHRTAGTAWRAAAEDMRREVLLFNQDVMANLTTLAAVYRE